MDFILLDTETTGLTQAKACEIGWLRLDANFNILDEQCYRTDPEKPIELGATEIHGIHDSDVRGKPTNAEICTKLPQPFVWIGHNCLTGDHEVLTKQGWVRLDTLASTVEAACWEPKDGSVVFANSEVVVKDHADKMFKYDTMFHSGVYTPKHVIVYTKTRHLLGGGLPVWETAYAEDYAKMAPNSVAIPAAGAYRPREVLDISPGQARVLEMVRADGSIEAENSIRLKFSKLRKLERCRHLLTALGVEFSEHSTHREGVRRIAILDAPLRKLLVTTLGVGKDKGLGSWVLDLSYEAREALLEEARFWDGNFTRSGKDNKQTSITSAKASECEWFQIASVLTDRSANVYLNKPNTRGFSRADGVLSSVTLRTKKHIKTLQTPEVVGHTGSVYCLTTPTGAFLVRRGGSVWVTGNCSYDIRVIGEHVMFNGDLCTLALSRRFVKNTTNHKLDTLKVELGLKRKGGLASHSALGDCYSTRELLLHVANLTGMNLTQLVELESVPKMLPKMPFGKHRGMAIKDMPKEYRTWLLSLPDLHKDLRYTLEKVKIL